MMIQNQWRNIDIKLFSINKVYLPDIYIPCPLDTAMIESAWTSTRNMSVLEWN